MKFVAYNAFLPKLIGDCDVEVAHPPAAATFPQLEGPHGFVIVPRHTHDNIKDAADC